MNIETAAGRLLLVGFEQNRFDEELARLLAEIRPGGVIFFGHNIAGAAEFADLVSHIVEALAEHGAPGEPPPLAPILAPILAIDLEGGRVDQLREVLAPFPASRAVAATNDDLFVRNFGALVGEAVASFGLNVTLAPVLDLASPEAEPVLGTRTASADPHQVVRFGRNFLAGLARQGVVGCGKHFPGLGSAPGDTHIEMPRVEKPVERFWEEDLLPFRELHNELSLMMLSHASYPSLDPSLEAAGSAPRPASISRELVGGLLRERIGFRGVVIADDLGMSGVLGGRSIGEAAVAALEAGCDLLPVCRSAENIRTVHRALVERAGQEASFADRIQEAAGRIETLQQELQKTAANRQQASTDWRRLAQAIRQLNEGAEDMGTLAASMPRYSAAAARPQRARRPPGGGGRAPRPGGARRERGDRRPGSGGPGRPRGPRSQGPRPRGHRPPREP